MGINPRGVEDKGFKMNKPFAVVFAGDLGEFFSPEFYATEAAATARLIECRNTLKDPSQVKVMLLVELD